MGFVVAVRACLSQYARFSGRSPRGEFWWFVLFNVAVVGLATLLDQWLATEDVYFGLGLVGSLVSLALFLPGLGVAVRRLHDTSRSGWWVLLAFVPLIQLILILFLAQDSHGDNQHGPGPEAAPGPA